MENNNSTIWVFNKPSNEATDFVYKSIIEFGYNRFGWSYTHDCNLNELKDGDFKNFNSDQKEIWKKTSFLLNIKPGDWIVNVNVPAYGKCIASEVEESYSFKMEHGNQLKDFFHAIKIKKNSIIKFDRNDINVLPRISRRLKLQGHYWRIYYKDEFFQSLANLSGRSVELREKEDKGTHHLRNDLNSKMSEIANLIHKNFPEKKLEYFIANVFEKIPNVVDVKVNGSGFGTDYGADIIVTYNAGLNISTLAKEETLIVQVKSYQGNHNDINSLSQICTGIKKFDADAGLLITTANISEEFKEKILEEQKKLQEDIKKEVIIGSIGGTELAKFILKYYGEELIFNL